LRAPCRHDVILQRLTTRRKSAPITPPAICARIAWRTAEPCADAASRAQRGSAFHCHGTSGTSGHKRASSHSPAPSELRFRQYHCAHAEGLSRQEMIQFERPIAAKTEVERAIIQALLAAGPCPQKRRIARGGHLYGGPTMRRAMQRDGALERRLGHEVSSKEMNWRILSAVDVFIAAYAA